MKTDTLTKQQKQKKFIIILIGIGLLIGLIFAGWYIWQKTNLSAESSFQNEQESKIPGNNLQEWAPLNVFNAKFIFDEGYDDYSVLRDFTLTVNTEGEYQKLNARQAMDLWNNFEKNYGKPDLDNARFESLGNSVTINFKTLEKNLDFKRVLSYKKAGEDYVINGDLLEKIPLPSSSKPILKNGDSLPEDLNFEALVDGKIVNINPFNDYKGKRILIVYCPSAFIDECNQEGLTLKKNYDRIRNSNIQLLYVLPNLIGINQLWLENYFGSLPYPVASDVEKKLAQLIGMEAETLMANKIILIDDQGIVNYISEAGNHFNDIKEKINFK